MTITEQKEIGYFIVDKNMKLNDTVYGIGTAYVQNIRCNWKPHKDYKINYIDKFRYYNKSQIITELPKTTKEKLIDKKYFLIECEITNQYITKNNHNDVIYTVLIKTNKIIPAGDLYDWFEEYIDKYDDRERLIIEYDEKTKTKTYYFYDEQDNLIQINSPDGRTKEYYHNGQLKKLNYLDVEYICNEFGYVTNYSSQFIKYKYEYDCNNNLIKSTKWFFNKDNSLHRSEDEKISLKREK